MRATFLMAAIGLALLSHSAIAAYCITEVARAENEARLAKACYQAARDRQQVLKFPGYGKPFIDK